MPADDGLGLDDYEGSHPAAPCPRQQDPERSVDVRQPRSRIALLVEGELLTEREVLDGEVATVSEH